MTLDRPTAAATYERARRLANSSMFAVELQVRRLQADEPNDGPFVLRRWFDFDCLVVALLRLRRAVTLAATIPAITEPLTEALRSFDEAIPDLKRLRDVAEHFDDYALEKGRRPDVGRRDLEVSQLSNDGPTLYWLGAEINAALALAEAARLIRALQGVVSLVPRDAAPEGTFTLSDFGQGEEGIDYDPPQRRA